MRQNQLSRIMNLVLILIFVIFPYNFVCLFIDLNSCSPIAFSKAQNRRKYFIVSDRCGAMRVTSE